MSEIAACTLIQEEPDRKTERYMMMFKDYPDVVSVDILQEMLGICRKNAYLLVKQNKIHSARVGRSYKIPKLCVVEYLIDQNRQLGGMRLSNSLAPSLQNTPESSKLMVPTNSERSLSILRKIIRVNILWKQWVFHAEINVCAIKCQPIIGRDLYSL